MVLKQYVVMMVAISVGEGVAGGLQPPLLGRNLLHSGTFPERTLGNSANISDCYPDRLTHSGRNVTAP